jgi:hypothetical protein
MDAITLSFLLHVKKMLAAGMASNVGTLVNSESERTWKEAKVSQLEIWGS